MEIDNPVVPVDLLARPVIGLSALAAIACFIASGALMLSLPPKVIGPGVAVGFLPCTLAGAGAGGEADATGNA